MKEIIDDFISWLKEDPKKIIYCLILFFGVAAIALLIILIFFVIRLLYFLSVARRQSGDYREAAKYINKNGKPLNSVQRFLLNQTGKVYPIKEIVQTSAWYAFCIIGGFVIGFCDLIEIPDNIHKILLILLSILFVADIVVLIITFRDLIQKGRIGKFVFWLLITFCYGYAIYEGWFVYKLM